MRRREFITFVGRSAVAWPLAARAQQASGMRRIGVLMGTPAQDAESKAELAGFRDSSQNLGGQRAAPSTSIIVSRLTPISTQYSRKN